MGIVESIVLGVIQGLTEFIPVSSSGHLVIAQYFFSGANDRTFLEYIDIGTFLALIIYFRTRIWKIFGDIFRRKQYKLARNIVITALPAGLIGLALSKVIDSATFFNSIVTVIVALFVVGMVMIVIERLPKASPVDDLADLSPGRALAVGIAQVFSLIPGVSRSGSTIIAGRLSGLNSEKAAEYSFLASVPIMFAVCAKVFISKSDQAYFASHAAILFASNLAAFIVGLLAIGFLLRYLARHSLVVFGWYRIILAVVIAIILVWIHYML